MRTWGITAPDFSWLGPHKVPVNVVVGAPIAVAKFEGDLRGEEGAAYVDRHHAQYVAALEALYEKHKVRAVGADVVTPPHTECLFARL
jgi:Diacylglycerol acyltransferase